jgi:hypothetical protein
MLSHLEVKIDCPECLADVHTTMCRLEADPDVECPECGSHFEVEVGLLREKMDLIRKKAIGERPLNPHFN